MQTMRSISSSFVTALLLGAALQLHASQQPIALSDGRTFAGWDGDTTVTWRIEDGAFVGGYLDREVPRNEFLASTRSFTNFVLRLKVKLIGTEGPANAGIQIRSQRLDQPPNEMIGYQADMGDGWWGALYDESRRNRVLAKPEPAAVERALKPGEWNDYLIRAEGRRIRTWINGVVMIDYVEADETLPQHGRIGLQIHGGAHAEAWYKDIVVEVLPDDPAPVTTATLLHEMTDLSGLALFPHPAYTCRQFSSYDRKSKSPQEDWFANHDRGHYLRVESNQGRQEYVMMDAEGPGAVVRIWSANPEGVLRIYLDGGAEPVLEAPMQDVLGGRYPGLPQPIAGERSKGWNLYFPIPYARHCKITSDNGDFYYHVNYRTYDQGTGVETFSPTHLKSLAESIATVAAELADPRRIRSNGGGQVEEFQVEIEPGATVRTSFWGPAAISRAVLRLDAAERDAALRGIVLRVAFDGHRTIECPLGDFFGTAPGINPYAALPLGMTADGEMISDWTMPFREEARIELLNHTGQRATLTGHLVLRPHAWTDRSMHFHAKWRADFEVPTRPMIDWNYLTATGRGVFVGAAFAIDNPVRDWWGEGDEKIYVDGEKFPSHFGTGTEDYFGYAWCWPGLFTHAYHAQPRCDGPGNYGRTSVNRFHILDRIPFTQDFRFDMELWHWHATTQVNMAVVAYWYTRPGGTDAFAPIRAVDAVVRPMAEYVVPRVAGAIEGEKLHIVRVTGTAGPQDWEGLSGGQHLWWHAGIKPGDTLTLAFQSPEAGRHRVIGHFLTARDYGIHQLAINGRNTGDPIDFYHADVRPSGQIDLGVFELKAGENLFTATAIGANDQALKSYMFGLDYLLLRKE
jgi:hypothetical protein